MIERSCRVPLARSQRTSNAAANLQARSAPGWCTRI